MIYVLYVVIVYFFSTLQVLSQNQHPIILLLPILNMILKIRTLQHHP